MAWRSTPAELVRRIGATVVAMQAGPCILISRSLLKKVLCALGSGTKDAVGGDSDIMGARLEPHAAPLSSHSRIFHGLSVIQL